MNKIRFERNKTFIIKVVCSLELIKQLIIIFIRIRYVVTTLVWGIDTITIAIGFGIEIANTLQDILL